VVFELVIDMSKCWLGKSIHTTRGFTLVEMMVILVIMSIVISIGVINIRDNRAFRVLEVTTEAVVHGLELARAQAENIIINSSQDQPVVFVYFGNSDGADHNIIVFEDNGTTPSTYDEGDTVIDRVSVSPLAPINVVCFLDVGSPAVCDNSDEMLIGFFRGQLSPDIVLPNLGINQKGGANMTLGDIDAIGSVTITASGAIVY
jgi:prepilin-type N-terminal cleavage/methylation domain-containing protein